MISDVETAMEEARRAGEGGPIDGFIERIAERVGAKATVKSVFGDPVERDGITIIPVAKVRWGFGGGAGMGAAPVAVGPGLDGTTDADGESTVPGDAGSGTRMTSGSGSGGGGGMTAEPVGYLEIGPDGATFIPITPAMPSPGFLLAAGATAALVLRALAKLLRR